MKIKLFDGKNWQEIESGGGGGSSHTHPNLSLLNSLTSTMVSAWNTASTWVSTNGATALSHLSDAVAHITATERSAWNAKYDLPTGGTAGQVLKKTTDGTEWANESGGGGGGFGGLVFRGSAAVKSTVSLVAECASTDTCIVYVMVSDSRRWSITVPLAEITSTATTYAIATGSNYRDFKLSKSGNTVTMTRSSTTAFTFYAYSF